MSVVLGLFLIIAFLSPVQSQAVFVPWSEKLTPRTEFSGRYAFRMHQVVPELNALCLLTNDSRLLIYDLDQPDVTPQEVLLESSVDYFCFSDGYFHCASRNEIYRVDPRSLEVSLEERFEQPDEFFPQFYYQERGVNYFLAANEMTYAVSDGQLELLDDHAWLLPGNQRMYAEIKPGIGFDLDFPTGSTRNYSANLLSSRGNSKVLSATPIGSGAGNVFLDIEIEDGDTIPTRLLVETNESGEIIKQTKIPFMYFIQVSPWSVAGGHVYYTLTTPKGFYLVRDGDFTGISTDQRFHYNYDLPLNPGEDQGDSLVMADSRAGGNCVTRTQVYMNALKYLNVAWTATSSNWVSSCTTIPGGTAKYRTSWTNVNYSSNGSKVSTPYKWGGFTKWTDWMNLVAAGKKTGNRFTPGSGTCSGTVYGDDSDAYIIGVDCSGGASRWWETSHNTTTSLPGISIYLGPAYTSSGFSALKKGDIANLYGSHTMMCTNDNPNGSATFIQASADNWNVQQHTYSYSDLPGYKSYRYKDISDNRIKLANSILLTPSTVNKNCPLTVNYKIKNDGTESWSGKVLLVLIQSNGVEVGLDGPYTVTLGPNQSSSMFTYSSPAFNYPTGSSKLEVRVKNTVTSCNYQLYYRVESGSYANPKLFTIYNNGCSAPPLTTGPISVNDARTLIIRLDNEQPADILIYDVTGRRMKKVACNNSECEIDLNGVPAGIYFASIVQSGNQVRSERFVISE